MNTRIFILIFISIQSPLFASELYINHIVIDGNLSFQRNFIIKITDLKEKQNFSSELVKKGIMDLEEYYHNQGYPLCKVLSYIDLQNNLRIHIEEGIIKEAFFIRLGYFRDFIVRKEFGNYINQIFYKPFFEKKLKLIERLVKAEKFDLEFIPVENEPGHYYLFITPKKETKKGESEELEPYVDFYFNFRGWFLSLVPYFYITFYNIGNIDHIIRLKVDVRFATAKWFDFNFESLRESVRNEYYEMDYFSLPFYKDLRFNFNSGVNINRSGRDDLGVSFKTIRFPFQLGVGFDFQYFWTSIRGGFIYEKLRNLGFEEDTHISQNSYPELLNERDVKYTVFSGIFNYIVSKKYVNEKDDIVEINMEYTFNNQYSWLNFGIRAEKVILYHHNVFFFRSRILYMTGKYPVYYQIGLIRDFYLRGYFDLNTNRAIDGGFEMWNPIYSDYIHTILFFDTGWFNNLTFNDYYNIGDFLFDYGFGISFSYQELNLRLQYAVPLKRRSDKGKFDFFYRMRF